MKLHLGKHRLAVHSKKLAQDQVVRRVVLEVPFESRELSQDREIRLTFIENRAYPGRELRLLELVRLHPRKCWSHQSQHQACYERPNPQGLAQVGPAQNKQIHNQPTRPKTREQRQ